MLLKVVAERWNIKYVAETQRINCRRSVLSSVGACIMHMSADGVTATGPSLHRPTAHIPHVPLRLGNWVALSAQYVHVDHSSVTGGAVIRAHSLLDIDTSHTARVCCVIRISSVAEIGPLSVQAMEASTCLYLFTALRGAVSRGTAASSVPFQF